MQCIGPTKPQNKSGNRLLKKRKHQRVKSTEDSDQSFSDIEIMIISTEECPTNHDRAGDSHCSGYKRQNIIQDDQELLQPRSSGESSLYSTQINSSMDLVEAMAHKEIVPLDLQSMTDYITSSFQSNYKLLSRMHTDIDCIQIHKDRKVTIRGHRGGFKGNMGTHQQRPDKMMDTQMNRALRM